MELYRVIFRVDFPTAFSLVNRWGDVLTLLNANKLWMTIGETPNGRQVVAQHNDAAVPANHNLMVALNYISGNIEQYPIKSLEPFERIFRDVTELAQLGDITSFARLGARFLFLEKAPFADVKDNVGRYISRDYLDSFKGELTDLSIVTVFKDGDNYRRLQTGPISEREYNVWFSMPNSLKVESGFLVDVDFYTFEYRFKTFDLRKFVDLAANEARKLSAAALKLVPKEEKVK